MSPRSHRKITGEQTVMVSAPVFHRSGKVWRDFVFSNLAKVSRSQLRIARDLERLLVGLDSPITAVQNRLEELFEDVVRVKLDYVHVVQPNLLKKYVGEPAFIAVLAPQPNKTRCFLEVDLSLAHGAIEMLLGGGAGERFALRSLTDIEEGVMAYVVLEIVRALAPSLDSSLSRPRFEGVYRGLPDVLREVRSESQLAVIQFGCLLGSLGGTARFILPSSVLEGSRPSDPAARLAKRAAEMSANFGRLSSVKAPIRVEIGRAEISSADLLELRERDVVLVEQLTVRPDKAESGKASLLVGRGQVAKINSDVYVENGHYKAKIVGFSFGNQPMQANTPNGNEMDENTCKSEGAKILNDIPLQISIELGRVPASAEEIVSLKVGQVIDLNRAPGEPVDLSVNGKIIARGELVEIEGNLGVRVLSLVGVAFDR